MKKLKLKALELGAKEVLTREQLKNWLAVTILIVMAFLGIHGIVVKMENVHLLAICHAIVPRLNVMEVQLPAVQVVPRW